MAEACTSMVQDQLICPVCLDALKDPVTTACGHTYCTVCINDFWDHEDHKGLYSCPQCRKLFTGRPELKKNIMIADMMEKLMASPTESVECDFCTRNKQKAVRSCLVCLASYCETHLQPHYQSPAFNKHKLVNASTRLYELICSQHEKPLEFYCHTDQQCICKLCTIDQHRGHHTTSAAEERAEKQKHFVETQRKCQQRFQESKKHFQELKKAVESHQLSVQAAVEDNERIFTEVIRSVKQKHSEGIQKIRAQEETVVGGAKGVLKRLEQEITALRRRNTELEQLSHTDDIYFLQRFQSLSVLPASADLSPTTDSPLVSLEDVTKSASQLNDQVEEFCYQEFTKTSQRVAGLATAGRRCYRLAAVCLLCVLLLAAIIVLWIRFSTERDQLLNNYKHIQINYRNLIAERDQLQRLADSVREPVTREEFLKYSCHFTLDPNSAHNHLNLSEGNRVVMCCNTSHLYPDHLDRFDYWYQVLGVEQVCGRCYWEVDWSKGVSLAVTYKGICRKGGGDECMLGGNDHSWKLYCSPSKCYSWHKLLKTTIPMVPSFRIGVYVDQRAGILSFYSISDTMRLLHRVQTTFTQPLYPGFGVTLGSTVKLSTPNIQMILGS